MRIVSGNFGGRVIKSPKGHLTHPMSEKIRGAIFNALGDIKGLSILDSFSGSGAIAIEAVSNGAEFVIAVDSSKDANRVITENVNELGINNIKIIRANVSSWSDNNKDAEFDIVISDPPYDKTQISLLKKLERHVKVGGIYVVSLPPNCIYASDLKLVKMKDYNDAVLYFFRKYK